MPMMFSASWYRVSNLRLKLRAHVEIHRQPYGDEVSYLLQDWSTGKLYRFNGPAYDLIGRMDGERTVDEIWQAMLALGDDSVPTQDEVISLLGQLHSADALQGDVTPDCVELFRRAKRHRRQHWLKTVRNPFSLKVPLFDPDRLLAALVPYVGWMFSALGAVIWALLIVLTGVLLAPHWGELTIYASEHALAPENLALLAVLYPVLKGLHELGHGIATKKWGGEVHEIGVTLLVFMPIPYVDASAASTLRRKRKRIAVSAAGMMVELFLASLAALVWLNVESGAIRSAAFDIMLIAGLSTVLFNANPLLRFDAYYILEDWIEVPNLASRSTRYLGYLVKRYVFRITDVVSPAARPVERWWFVAYGVCSNPYRWFITVTIIWFVAGEYFLVGIGLAIWALITQIVYPLGKALSFVLRDPSLGKMRGRALAAVGTAGLALGAGLFLVPAPSSTVAEGVVSLPEDAHIKVAAAGFVHRSHYDGPADIKAGTPLLELSAPLLPANLALARAQLDELGARRRLARREDLLEAKSLDEEIRAKRAEVAEAQASLGELIVKSPMAGRFVPAYRHDLNGRYFHKGDLIGYVLRPDSAYLRVAVPQDHAGRVRDELEEVTVKLTDRIGSAFPGRLIRIVPAAQSRLPSPVLGTAGGGALALDPNDSNGEQVVEPIFVFEIALDAVPANLCLGLRALVRFSHPDEPLGRQLFRATRQLFLSRFGV